MSGAQRVLLSVLDRLGLERKGDHRYYKTQLPVEWSDDDRALFAYVKEQALTMTYDRGLIATIDACRYAAERGIEGDFVECGVWRGGNAILAAAIFKRYGVRKRVYLFDTFQGMTEPTDADRRAATGEAAYREYAAGSRATHNEMCYASLDDVRANFERAGLLNADIVFVQGDVLQTLAQEANLPQHIAVLRLDTDWYESTKRELEVLYPRVTAGGVLIVDDYGYWTGARKATDEYFAGTGKRPLLQYVDFTGRAAVKTE